MLNNRTFSRRLVAICCAVVVVVLTAPHALAEDLPVSSTEDVVAPVVSSVSISPSGVDVRDGINKTFTATLTATDDLSGIAWVSLSYRAPSGASQFISFSFNRTAGDARSGTYVATTTVTPLFPNGTYALHSMQISDVVGNFRSYNVTHDIAPASLTVQSNADSVPPVTDSITVSPNPVDVSDSIQTVEVEVGVTDDRSGVRFVSGLFYSPSSRQAASFNAQPVAGEPGVARGITTVAQYSEPGEWKLVLLCAYDMAWNQHCFSAASTPTVAEKFGSAALQVISDPADATRPSVSGFRLSPTAIDVTEGNATVRTDFDVSDNLSGVQSAYIVFTSPRTAGASPEVIARYGFANAPSIYRYTSNSDGTWTITEDDTKRLLSGTLSASTLFPRYDRSGEWKVDRVCVIDNVNWQTCYTAGSTPSLATIGPDKLTVEWNRTPVVAVTGITQASYVAGSEPTPGCDASDVEDGTITGVTPVVTGPDANGVVTVRCSYTDVGGLVGTAVKTYEVVTPSNTAPTVQVTGVTGTTYEHGSVPVAGCAVTDAEDEDESATPAAGAVTGPLASQGLGTVTVTCSYTDASGLTATDTVTYTIADTQPPALQLTNRTAWATGSSGAAVTYTAAATDAVDANPGVSCTPPSGTTFPIGTTVVSCTARDAAGNESSGTFTVTVRPSCTASTLRQPVNADGSSVFKLGSAVPLKIVLSGCYGTSPDQVAPVVALRRLDTAPDGAVNEVLSTGSANEGTTMRYDGSGHAYNLSTKRSQFCSSSSSYCTNGDLTAGTYEVTITAAELATPVRGTFNLRR